MTVSWQKILLGERATVWKQLDCRFFISRKTSNLETALCKYYVIYVNASVVFQVSQRTYASGRVRAAAVNISPPGHVFGSTFTSGFPEKNPLTQSSGFSSNASPPAARTARGSGRRLAWACSSVVRRCSRCGKGKAAYTSRSRWREGQSRGRSVREGGYRGIFQCRALTL